MCTSGGTLPLYERRQSSPPCSSVKFFNVPLHSGFIQIDKVQPLAEQSSFALASVLSSWVKFPRKASAKALASDNRFSCTVWTTWSEGGTLKELNILQCMHIVCESTQLHQALPTGLQIPVHCNQRYFTKHCPHHSAHNDDWGCWLTFTALHNESPVLLTLKAFHLLSACDVWVALHNT